MRSIVFLMALACGVYCNENLPSQLLLQPRNKRGINGDHSVTFPSESSSSYSAPIHSSSGYELGESSSGFSLGHAGLLNSGGSGHGIKYLASSNGLSLGSGYQSSGLNHGSLNHQSVSLGGHSAQSTYSVPSIANIGSGGSSNALFTPSKNGPVTFGLHGGSSNAASTSGSYSTPAYASGGHGLSAYSNGAPNAGLQFVLGSSQHGLSLGSSDTSSYSLPVHSGSSNPSHAVTGGLIIASGSHGSSSGYSLPTSASSHGISGLSSSSGIHGALTYTLPISSGSHGISALSSSGSSDYPSSGSYGSSSTHSGFSGVSSGGSNYKLPITSGSYSNSGSSNGISHVNYVSSGSSSSYSSPSVSYATPSINHVGSSGSGYSGSGASYSLNSNYAGSSSSPIVTYTGSRGYTPTYYSSSSHGTSADSHGAYTSVSPRYTRYLEVYAPGTKFYNVNSNSAKYDTISYSVPNGKI